MLMKDIMCMSVVTMHHAVLMSFYAIIKVMVILLFTLTNYYVHHKTTGEFYFNLLARE